jgi:hypothetical protein
MAEPRTFGVDVTPRDLGKLPDPIDVSSQLTGGLTLDFGELSKQAAAQTGDEWAGFEEVSPLEATNEMALTFLRPKSYSREILLFPNLSPVTQKY